MKQGILDPPPTSSICDILTPSSATFSLNYLKKAEICDRIGSEIC